VKHITPVLLAAAGLISPCYAGPVTPNFTSGTITSETKTRTEVIEVIKQIEYSTGTSILSLVLTLIFLPIQVQERTIQ